MYVKAKLQAMYEIFTYFENPEKCKKYAARAHRANKANIKQSLQSVPKC